jgi:hypothetical protein
LGRRPDLPPSRAALRACRAGASAKAGGRADVEAFVSEPALAVVGVSRTGKKFGNIACRELRAKGFRVYPIHPSADRIDGVK